MSERTVPNTNILALNAENSAETDVAAIVARLYVLQRAIQKLSDAFGDDKISLPAESAAMLERMGRERDGWRECANKSARDANEAERKLAEAEQELAVVKEELAQYKKDNGIFGAGA